jgi:hypothetical protein
LHLKELRGSTVGEKVTLWDGKVLEELPFVAQGKQGLSGPSKLWVNGRAWETRHPPAAGKRRSSAEYIDNYGILVQLVKDYFKWFGCLGIALRGFLRDRWEGLRLALADAKYKV